MSLIRQLGNYPITLFGGVSLAAYVVAAFSTTSPGPVIRALMLPAYVVQLVIYAIFGSAFERVGTTMHWAMAIPLYFAPFVLFDLALSRASRSGPETEGRGIV